MEKTNQNKMQSVRDGFGRGLLAAGKEDDRIVVLTGNLGESTRVHWFAEEFPQRFFDVGVAEQALVTVAAGLSLAGKIPFITSYAVFSPGRTFEQIKVTVSLNNVPVKIVGAHAGFGAGPYGATHQSLEDIALMRVIPNMVVIAPADYEEAKKATLAAAQNGKPTYLRLARQESLVFTSPRASFEIGKADILVKSRDPQVAIIGCGPILSEALSAAEKLDQLGIETEVINLHTIKPIDTEAIIHAARIAGAIVTVEEHQVAGGLGSAVAEVLAQNQPVPIEFVGVRDSYGESGTAEELMTKYGLKAKNILEAAHTAIARKNT